MQTKLKPGLLWHNVRWCPSNWPPSKWPSRNLVEHFCTANSRRAPKHRCQTREQDRWMVPMDPDWRSWPHATSLSYHRSPAKPNHYLERPRRQRTTTFSTGPVIQNYRWWPSTREHLVHHRLGTNFAKRLNDSNVHLRWIAMLAPKKLFSWYHLKIKYWELINFT